MLANISSSDVERFCKGLTCNTRVIYFIQWWWFLALKEAEVIWSFFTFHLFISLFNFFLFFFFENDDEERKKKRFGTKFFLVECWYQKKKSRLVWSEKCRLLGLQGCLLSLPQCLVAYYHHIFLVLYFWLRNNFFLVLLFEVFSDLMGIKIV